MNLRSFLLVGGGLLLGFGQAARGEYQWTSSSYFAPGGAPQSNGAGTFTFGLAPAGTGGGPSAPVDQTNGYETAQGYVIHYMTAAADVGHDVVITWTADRDFLSAALPSYTTIAITFRAELTSEGNGLTLGYDAETRHRDFGGPSAVSVSDSFDLAPGNAIKNVSASNTSGTFVPPGGVTDSLQQTVTFTITPGAAGQDLAIYFTPNGVISAGNNVGDVTAVPAPPALILCLSAVPLLGAMWLRAGRGKLA